MSSSELTVSQRGVITLPKAIRDRYDIHPGDRLSILDLDGIIVLAPRSTQIASAASRLRRSLEDRGESLESMLSTLREEREKYG
jgi:AbrB family looped-hinge helix DNA binding protein